MSIKCLSAILGPEMAAPILWTPAEKASVLQENRHVHKIPRFREGGGGYFGFFFCRGGSADLIFMGARIFLIYVCALFGGLRSERRPSSDLPSLCTSLAQACRLLWGFQEEDIPAKLCFGREGRGCPKCLACWKGFWKRL